MFYFYVFLFEWTLINSEFILVCVKFISWYLFKRFVKFPSTISELFLSSFTGLWCLHTQHFIWFSFNFKLWNRNSDDEKSALHPYVTLYKNLNVLTRKYIKENQHFWEEKCWDRKLNGRKIKHEGEWGSANSNSQNRNIWSEDERTWKRTETPKNLMGNHRRLFVAPIPILSLRWFLIWKAILMTLMAE